MSAPDLASQAAMAGNYPAIDFNKREQKLLASVKTYVDAASGETLTAGNMSIGNSSNVAIDVDLTTSAASRIIARVKSATFTVTIASPGVFTSTAHGLLNGDAVVLSTTGALPTGLAAATTYYVVNKNTNTFELSATQSGTSINTSGSQSGTHTFSASGLAPRALSITNSDIAAAAAISYSKLNLATSIVNADVSTSAAIAYSKLNLATSIVNADIGTSAAIAYSKLALSNSIVAGDLTSSSVTLAKLHSGISPSHVVKFAGSFTTAGGDANESITVTGAAATDIAICVLHTKGATPRTILTAQAATNAINIEMSGDPSTDHVIKYMVLTAAS